MAKLNAVGRDASVRKYDVLSALMLLGLHGAKADVKLAARLCLLVTTRYNWQRDELTVGQTDIARLWNVGDVWIVSDGDFNGKPPALVSGWA